MNYKSLIAIIFIAINVHFTPAVGQSDAQITVQAGAEACIVPNEFVELPQAVAGTQTDAYGKTTVALGSYERISPDGRFVLRSFSGTRLGDVSLIELGSARAGVPTQVLRAYETPLANEAFPVQGSWRYLVNTNGDHFNLADVLAQQQRAKPQFRGGMTGFYAAASELPGSTQGQVKIRSFSWPNASGNAETQGEGALSVRTIEVDVTRQRIVADSGSQLICAERVREDGPMYALPMISVNGQEFAALPQTPPRSATGTGQGAQTDEPTMRIYGFGASGKGCEPRTTFAFSSGKALFGFAHRERGADVVWEYKGNVWWYSRELGQRFNIAPYAAPGGPVQGLEASAFPGLTRDGRVIYGATWKACNAGGACQPRAGYVIADPVQSNAYQQFLQVYKGTANRQCVTSADVARERSAFAAARGIPVGTPR